MTTPRFLIAKYAPDISRMEPRNIGLMLWHKGRLQAKFLDVTDAPFVNEANVYVDWVEYWTGLIAPPVIDVPGVEPVPKSDERCIDALLASQEGNYILVDAGFVPAKLSVRDMPKAVEYLFSQLVAPIAPTIEDDSEHRAPNLIAQCEAIFERAGIGSRDEFKRNEPVSCPVFGVRRNLHCNYYYGNGEPLAIFQRARLSSEQSVNSGALMVRALTDAAVIEPSQCRFLVKRHEVANDAAAEGLEFLNRLCGIIDVDDDDAAEQVAAIARVNPEG